MMYEYVKDRAAYLSLFCIFALVFGLLTFLQGLPMDAVWYGVLVCLSLLGILACFDCAAYRRRHRALVAAQQTVINSLGYLPMAKGVQEQDYQELLWVLHDQLRRLETKQKMEYAEMKDFYALWVHQIKTPIAAMSLLLQEQESEKNKQLLLELFRIERYAELVLQYLRLDEIHTDLSLEACSLDKMVKQAVKKYAPIFITKHISVQMEDLALSVVTDDKWLTLVIEQLLSNALKYTAVHGLVRIYAQNDTLCIADNGIGIAKEDLPRVFEKGFTGLNGRIDQRATGLGLYLSKKTLDKLGHGITIDSEEGRGTTVTLDLSRRNLPFE